MEALFKDIVAINGVQSITLLDMSGKVSYEATNAQLTGAKQRYTNWKKLIDVLENTREADFVFDNGRIYLRRTDIGFLLVSMQSYASIAMVKLNCDIVLPQLKNQKTRGLKGFFKR